MTSRAGLSSCEPCFYAQLRVTSLNNRSGALESGCITAASLATAAFTTTAINGAVVSGPLTAETYAGAAVTAVSAALEGAAAETLTASSSLLLNGVSGAPDATVIPTTTATYTVPITFANNGAIVASPTAINPFTLRLPPSASVPVGYEISVYNLGSASLTVQKSIADPGIAFFSKKGNAVSSATLNSAKMTRYVWTGTSWFVWPLYPT
jgi:hypothetical protein